MPPGAGTHHQHHLMLAIADALALTVLEERGFSAEQYGRCIPPAPWGEN